MLIGMELLTELVRTVLISGRVFGCDPLSLLLLAAPESGKTSVVLEEPCESAFPLTDVTGKGIQHLCTMQPQISHIILNDLVAVQSHRPTVNHFTLAMLNAMTEEGIMAIASPAGIERFENGKRGLIACLTLKMAGDGRAWWNRTGFSTRLIPFAYEYPEPLILKIKTAILAGTESKNIPKRVLKIPAAKLKVSFPEKLRPEVLHFANHIAKQLNEQGIRRVRQFRTLVMAHAIMRGWKHPSVEKIDLDFLSRLNPYISYTKATPL